MADCTARLNAVPVGAAGQGLLQLWLRLCTVLVPDLRRCVCVTAFPSVGTPVGFPLSTHPAVLGNLQGSAPAAASWPKPASEFGGEAFLYHLRWLEIRWGQAESDLCLGEVRLSDFSPGSIYLGFCKNHSVPGAEAALLPPLFRLCGGGGFSVLLLQLQHLAGENIAVCWVSSCCQMPHARRIWYWRYRAGLLKLGLPVSCSGFFRLQTHFFVPAQGAKKPISFFFKKNKQQNKQ